MGSRVGASSSAYVKNFFLFVAITSVVVMSDSVEESKESQTYIVHVEEPEMRPLTLDERKKWYLSFLSETAAGDSHANLLHAYESVITGFAARLTKSHMEAIREMPGFIQAYPDTALHLQTTYSSQFLGLDHSKGLWPRSNTGKGIIIGMLDGGVWPDSLSFKPDGNVLTGVPSRWKGVCQTAPDFNASNCNTKLIGARVYTGDGTPRDLDGHGTHTASTAAGNPVANAGFFGNANGTARGMAPGAHLAIYKVCRDGLCLTSDVLAGMEAAILDGVDVLSLSIGGSSSAPFYQDGIAVGAFRAMQRGIFVSCAAGNDGPAEPSYLYNSAPWMMTVGASAMDRHFVANVKLGDGTTLYGESLFDQAKRLDVSTELVMGDLCLHEALDPSVVKRKLVVCIASGPANPVQQGEAVREAGGAGMIFLNDNYAGEEIRASAHVLPATNLGFKAGLALQAYMASTKTPTAAIQFEGTVFGAANNISAPAVASFSSRGPSLVSPDILKPDVIAPGFAVLAAWPFDVGPSEIRQDKRRVMFNIMYGTSMATPHVSGVAALLRSAHPQWSPAAIMSALITTADHLDKKGQLIVDGGNNYAPADIFATGAGQINPERSADPGLIYDLTAQDYVPYLCALNYTASQIRIILNKNVVCSADDEGTLPGNLNYPSFSLIFNNSISVTLRRTVTNVGAAKSTYRVNIDPPRGVGVNVSPSCLAFTAVNEKKSYNVTFALNEVNTQTRFSQGSLTWVSTSAPVYSVRSPVAISWNEN